MLVVAGDDAAAKLWVEELHSKHVTPPSLVGGVTRREGLVLLESVGEVGALPKVGQSRKSRLRGNYKTWKPYVDNVVKLKLTRSLYVYRKTIVGIIVTAGREERFGGTFSHSCL